MFGLKSFKLSLLLTWMLPFTETGQFSKMTATVGDDVTLTCEGFREFNDQCFSTTWKYSDSVKTEPLYEQGKIHREAGSKSDRLNVTEKCFLVIKKVTVEDDGFYTCRQDESSGRVVTESAVLLSVTNKTTTTTSPQASVAPTTDGKTGSNSDFLLASLISAAVASAALLITTVMIIRWRKTKGNKTQMDDGAELSFNSAGTRSGPETSQDTADHADMIQYASISNTSMSNTGARVDSKDHDEHRVTYSTVKAPAAASTNPTDLYATIQEYR
ncbi:uncharacterized protein LOC121633515 isoform X3 [Melanotaenia boesemani]|uniref:uncharacterized protein LOC121633515 isoform X3 n=1 Tax=Melanotaenia boesemani TaxID=1250792 RepID=UPI001C04975C|nr:uncharacterized protein LOC121633515 isoform X3 [Melanotaenia boesemani]